MTIQQSSIAEVAVPKGLIGGPFGSSLVGNDYEQAGVPVIRGTNLGHGKYVDGEFVFVSEEKVARDLARNIASAGDVVFTQRGTLGQVALVPREGFHRYVISQSQMRLRVDPAVATPEYLYYACSSGVFQKQIADNAISTGVPHINLGILSRLKIPLPSIHEQRAIAEVLGALDDKTAANSKLAQVALDLASAHFRDAIRNSEWSDKTFEDLADVSGGGTPSTKVPEYWDGELAWATPTDVTALEGPYLSKTSRRITEKGLDSCSSALFKPGAILMTSRATIGAFAITEQPTAVNQGFIVVQPVYPTLKWWLFHEMRSRVDEFVSLSNGATFLELSRGNFRRLRVRLAQESVMHKFDELARILHDAARAALDENHTLAATRDALLPQLMSGALRIKDAEKAIEEVL